MGVESQWSANAKPRTMSRLMAWALSWAFDAHPARGLELLAAGVEAELQPTVPPGSVDQGLNALAMAFRHLVHAVIHLAVLAILDDDLGGLGVAALDLALDDDLQIAIGLRGSEL